jgi:alpha-tubulin suppressor-like RCC1 family protein
MKLKILQQDTAVVTGNKTFNSGDLISLKIKKKIKYKILLFSGNLINTAGSLGPAFIPRGTTASYGGYEDKILVQWDNITGVNGYKVFKDDTTLAGTVSTNSFFDTVSLPGTLFKYNIKSFVKQNGFTLESNLSSPVYGWRGLTAPANFTTSDGSYFDRVILSWNGVTGATAYKVYRYDTSVPPQTLSLLATTTNTAYTDYSVLIGRKYIYALKSSCSLGDSNFGVTGNASLTRGYIFPPSGVTASKGVYTDHVNITWNNISGISGYKIYRNLPILQNIGTTSGIQFNDYTATPNTVYTYYVTSYDLIRGESSPSVTTTGYVDSVFYIYVSTGGNDNNTGEDPTDGLSTGPVATLNKAVQIASNYTGDRNNIQIILRGGIYKILGTSLNPALYLEGVTKSITFKNYNSETVIISGSEDVPYTKFSLLNSTDSNWNRFKPEVTNNIYVADVSDFDLGVLPTNWRGKRITGGDNGNIPDLPGIPWLVYNNEFMTLARWPNKTGITSSGYSYSECATISNSPNSIISTSPRSYNIFKYRDEYDTTIQRWVNNGAISDGAWINIFGYYDWVSETVKVTGITLSSAINSGFTAAIKLDMRSSAYGIQNNSLCNGGITYTNPTPRRWFIENIIDELDAPGEYYIDRSNKKLYFYPPTPIGITSSVLLTHRATYGPAALEADQPLKMTYERGYNSSSGNPVYGAAIGNTFGYYPYEGWTGAYIRNVGYSNSGGLIQSRYPWNTVATIDSMFKFYKTKNINIEGLIFKNCSGSGIKLELCENITIKNCLIYNMKKNAIRSLGGKNISIEDCLIQDIGSDAIINIGGNRRTLEYGNNTVTGCLIRRWATNGPDQGNGIVINGCGNTVSYNVFNYGFGKAIENNHSNFNTIEYNYFNNILADTDDQGAIYSYASKSSFGNTIRYNFFDNIGTKLPGGIGQINRPWPNIGNPIYSGCTGPTTYITPAIYIDGYENFANIYANTFYRCKNPGGCIYSAGTLHDVTNNIFVDSSAAISILRPSYNTLNTSYSSFLEAQKTLNLFNDPWLEQGAGYSAGQLQFSTGYGPWNSFVCNFGEDYYLIYDNNNGYTGSKGMMNVVDITTPAWQQAEPRLSQLIGITGSGVNRRMGLSLGYASTAKTTYTNNLVTGCCGSYWIGVTGSYSLPSNPLIGGFSGANNNMVTSGFTGFTDKQNLNFKLTTKGLTDIQAVIPQFQNIPFESIPGISYNPITTTETVYTPNTQTWYVPGITNANPDAGNYASIHVGHSPVVFYTTADGTVGYITRDITRIFNLNVDLTPPANVGKCKQIVVGYQCVTALRIDGTLVSWGKINGSTIELAAQTDWFQQQLTQKGRTVKKIAGGAGHVLALLDTGEVVAWGSNEAAQLSDPNTVWSYIGLIPRPTATDHKYLTGFTAYASQEYLQDASSYLVTLDTPNACVPVIDPSLRYRQFRSLNPGCTLHATFPQGGYDTPYVFNGITYPGPEFTPGFSWKGKINWRPITGAPYDYQFSRQTTGDTLSVNYSRKGGWTQGTEHIPVNDSATQVYNYLPNSVFGTAGITYVDIAANRSNSMALTSEGTIQIWGWNWYYNVTGSGDESENGASGWSRTGAGTSGGGPGGGWDSASAYIPAKPRPIPDSPSGDKTATTVKTLKTTVNSVSKIGVGYYTQYVIKPDGSLFGWDRNEWGETTPRRNSDGTLGLPIGPFTQVAGGYHHAIALRQNGTVACWGENNDGECNVPPNLTDVVWVGASYRISFALKSDGTLIAWGGLDNFIKNPGLGVNPPAPEQQPALNLFVGTWFEIPGASSLTNITPFTWVSYNDILDINNITTTIETPAAVSSRLQQIPVGRRILAPRRYWGARSVWGATTDNIPSRSIPGITNVTPWADTAIKGLTTEWNPWMDSLVSLGTTFDFLIMDQENQYVISSYDANFTEKLRGYTSDTRYTQAKYGISSLSDLLSGITISNVTQLASSSGMEYIAFNKVIGQYGTAVLNRALWDYSKQKLPNLRGSNYNGYLSTVNPAPDLNGHPQAHDERFGTASAPDMYGMQGQLNTAWYVNKTNPSQLIYRYTAPGGYTDADLITRTVWSGFIQAQQLARSVRRSDASKGFHPWIATPGYTGDSTSIPVLYPSDDRYYYESIRHLGLLGAEVILYWNPSNVGGLSLTYATKINSVVDELATKFNNKKIRQTVPSGLTAISWNADYITTGAVLANNTYLWRTSFKNDITQVINDTTGITYEMGGSTCGVWDTSATNTPPSYTVIFPFAVQFDTVFKYLINRYEPESAQGEIAVAQTLGVSLSENPFNTGGSVMSAFQYVVNPSTIGASAGWFDPFTHPRYYANAVKSTYTPFERAKSQQNANLKFIDYDLRALLAVDYHYNQGGYATSFFNIGPKFTWDPDDSDLEQQISFNIQQNHDNGIKRIMLHSPYGYIRSAMSDLLAVGAWRAVPWISDRYSSEGFKFDSYLTLQESTTIRDLLNDPLAIRNALLGVTVDGITDTNLNTLYRGLTFLEGTVAAKRDFNRANTIGYTMSVNVGSPWIKYPQGLTWQGGWFSSNTPGLCFDKRTLIMYDGSTFSDTPPTINNTFTPANIPAGSETGLSFGYGTKLLNSLNKLSTEWGDKIEFIGYLGMLPYGPMYETAVPWMFYKDPTNNENVKYTKWRLDASVSHWKNKFKSPHDGFAHVFMDASAVIDRTYHKYQAPGFTAWKNILAPGVSFIENIPVSWARDQYNYSRGISGPNTNKAVILGTETFAQYMFKYDAYYGDPTRTEQSRFNGDSVPRHWCLDDDIATDLHSKSYDLLLGQRKWGITYSNTIWGRGVCGSSDLGEILTVDTPANMQTLDAYPMFYNSFIGISGSVLYWKKIPNTTYLGNTSGIPWNRDRRFRLFYLYPMMLALNTTIVDHMHDGMGYYRPQESGWFDISLGKTFNNNMESSAEYPVVASYPRSNRKTPTTPPRNYWSGNKTSSEFELLYACMKAGVTMGLNSLGFDNLYNQLYTEGATGF